MSLNDWILQQTGSALGGEDIYANTLKPEFNQYQSGFYQSQEAVGKFNTMQDELSKLGGSSSGLQAFKTKYNVDWTDLTGSGSRGWSFKEGSTSQNILKKSGYAPVNESQYFAGKYGANTRYSQAQIANAQTERYGEIQGQQDLGQGWKDLYSQYDKWRQEDSIWYEDMKQYKGLGDDAEKYQKAKMAAGGMKTGSQGWKDQLSRIDSMKLNLEDEYQEKGEALKGTSIYQALNDQYQELYRKPQVRIKGEDVEKLTDSGALRSWVGGSPEDWERYTEYEEKSVNTGKLLYGAGEGQTDIASFDDFYKQNFGEQKIIKDAGYGASDLSNVEETDDEQRARISASGANV